MTNSRICRRGAVLGGFAALVGLLSTSAALLLPAADSPRAIKPDTAYGYGRCHAYKCSCFGFQGTGYTCTRGGCGHHYDLHY